MEKTATWGKRIAMCMLAVATAFAFMPGIVGVAKADPIVAKQGDFEFTIYDDGGGHGSLWVTKYTGTATEIELPTSVTHNGTTYAAPGFALEAGEGLFAGNTTIKKIALPSGYDGIAENAFKGCTSLAEIAASDNIVFIANGAFADCPNLTTYRIGGSNIMSGGVSASCGIGQDSAGNVYPGVTVYTIAGSEIDKLVQSINATSTASGNGNQIKLVYEADPYAGNTVKPGSGQGSGADGSSSSAAGGATDGSGLGEGNTPLGKGATADAAKAFLTGYSAESDPKGSAYGLLQAKMSKVTKSSIKLSWKKVAGASKYVIYGNLCGKKNKYVEQTSTAKTNITMKKVGGKAIKKGTYYKFIVVALTSANKVASTSVTVHAATLGGKVGNDRSVKTAAKKNKVSIKAKKTFKLKAKTVPAKKKLKVKKHRAIKYESANKAIATVNAKGVIKGVKKGSTYVFAYAQDGVAAKVKVTVK